MTAKRSNARLIINGKPLKGVKEALTDCTLETAIKISNNAKHLVRKDTGILTSSIMYKTQNTNGGYNEGGKEPVPIDARLTTNPKPRDAIIGTNLKYGTYQEFGTRKMAPRPWLRPAVEVAKGASMLQVVKQINIEKMKGALKEGEGIREFKI